MKPLLEIAGLSVSFRTYRGLLEAVHGVSLQVYAGETVGIVGESGCGKSVTTQSVMKLLPRKETVYTGGTITWDGKDITQYDEQAMNRLRGKEMTMIFQDPMTALNPVLSIGSQLREALRTQRRLSPAAAATASLELLRAVGLTAPEKRLRQYPHELSGGMRQRCLIALALACRPRLLFADEPTTALDVTTEAQVLALLENLQRELQMAVVLVSHNLGVIAQLCRRVYVMYAGTVVEEGMTETLFVAPAHPYTQGLLASLPDPENREKKLIGIDGQAPDLFHYSRGCRFCLRCPQAMCICSRREPPTYELRNGQKVSCWLYCPERGGV
ncbi:ABC transporter ATP-binding protein [Megasphaera vaginalis (ex Bordigoni et al. 2020)]|uniref:ABC transporter ATP-binding protein n=1 Tax=Megasphaera vaginalis (ex Bordigoni et al. 2020) TaxID=2045301 RepID=UPI000C79CBEB|nr:ABC transporter ATP-binding protein [Megasphaera vaginalis (ex Bordigoni et al. 2020)]